MSFWDYFCIWLAVQSFDCVANLIGYVLGRLYFSHKYPSLSRLNRSIQAPPSGPGGPP